jgi:hypothetical protein
LSIKPPSVGVAMPMSRPRELAAGFEATRAAAGRGELELTAGRPAVLETGIELHRWWEARWRDSRARRF